MSYEQLKTFVSNVITAGKLSSDEFLATQNNTAKLLDKIGKIVTLDTVYNVDKLALFDGEYLSFGKSIEEWSEDLIAVEQKDDSGSGAMSPHRPTYRPVFYSYTTGKYVVKTTIDYNDLERAVHFVEQFAQLMSMKYKRIEDSMAVYRYALKREMIAKLYSIANDSVLGMSGSDVDSGTWDADSNPKTDSWATAMNEKAVSGLYILVVQDFTGGDAGLNGKYIAVKDIAQASTKTIVELIADGSLIKLDLVTTIAKPVDTSTGENFIRQVKADVEQFSDLSEGHSLNGNSLGATEGLVLIVKQNIMPSIEVDTWAGAFNKELVNLPAETIVVKDFGSCDSKVYALLIDRRGMRLHPTYNATRENLNGDGDFLNIFRHTENTAYISRNVAFKFYKES